MQLRIFNPSHDECLASGSPYYTPSKTAQLMDNVHIPGWSCLDDSLPAWDTVESIEPWGWDARLVTALRKRGCPERLLPTEVQLADIRRLSSRETCTRILPQLTGDFESLWFTDINSPLLQDAELGRNYIYKAPWSCSGRGVFSFDAKRIQKIVREQGGIEVEPLYARVADFAMEFTCHEGTTHFLGLSAMMNDAANHYGGNLVLPNEDIMELLSRYVKRQEVENTREALIGVLNKEIAPYYEGPLGVDQMIVKTPHFALHPCVEINLRHTMGHVALDLLHI